MHGRTTITDPTRRAERRRTMRAAPPGHARGGPHHRGPASRRRHVHRRNRGAAPTRTGWDR